MRRFPEKIPQIELAIMARLFSDSGFALNPHGYFIRCDVKGSRNTSEEHTFPFYAGLHYGVPMMDHGEPLAEYRTRLDNFSDARTALENGAMQIRDGINPGFLQIAKFDTSSGLYIVPNGFEVPALVQPLSTRERSGAYFPLMRAFLDVD